MSHLVRSVGRPLALLLLLAGILAACGAATDAAPEATPAQGGVTDPLAATSWRLLSLGGQSLLPGTFGTAVFGEYSAHIQAHRRRHLQPRLRHHRGAYLRVRGVGVCLGGG